MNKARAMQLQGDLIFILTGIMATSTSVVASDLRDRFGFDYGLTGTLLSFFNLGTFIVGFLSGILAAKLGLKKSSLLLAPTFTLGFVLLALFGMPGILMAGFFLIGAGRGMVTNTCNVMVGESAENKTRALNLLHACYAVGALLSPVLIMAITGFGPSAPSLVLAVLGLPLVYIVAISGLSTKPQTKEQTKGDLNFLKSPRFILLTLILMCQNGAETAVVSWVVTYYKDAGVFGPELSNYTLTIIWGATLVGRLLVAFVLPIKSPPKSLVVMGVLASISYALLMFCHTGLTVAGGLALFALSLAGSNPTAVSCAGKELTPMSLSIMLPTASVAQILMPWIIGLVADRAGLEAGMSLNLIPCIGLAVAAFFFWRLKERERAAQQPAAK